MAQLHALNAQRITDFEMILIFLEKNWLLKYAKTLRYTLFHFKFRAETLCVTMEVRIVNLVQSELAKICVKAMAGNNSQLVFRVVNTISYLIGTCHQGC